MQKYNNQRVFLIDRDALFVCKEKEGDFMKRWWQDTGIKVVRTMAQTAVGVISGAAIFSEVDWLMVLSASGIAGVTCFLMSVGNMKTVTELENERDE